MVAKTNEICPLAASKLGLWLHQQQRSTAVCMSSTETRHVVCALLPPARAGCCIVSGWKPASRSVELFWMLMSGAPTSNSSWSLSAATRSCHWIAIIYSPWSYRFPLIVFLFPLAMLAFFARFPAPVFYGDGLAQPHFQRSITRAKSVLKEAPVPSLKLRRQLCSCFS